MCVYICIRKERERKGENAFCRREEHFVRLARLTAARVIFGATAGRRLVFLKSTPTG